MFRPLLIGVVLATTGALAAPKAPKADQAKKYLDAAIRLYNAFEFERALEQLVKARAQSTGAEMDVTISLYEGIVQLELGRDDAAETAFKTALSLDPKAALPTRVSPKVQQLFDALKEQMTKPIPPPPPKEDPKPPPPTTPEPAPTPVVVKPAPAQPSKSLLRLAPAVLGVAAAVVGPVLLLQAKNRSDQLAGRTMTADFDVATAERYRSEGKLFQTLGFAAIGVGAALIVASVVWYFLVGA